MRKLISAILILLMFILLSPANLTVEATSFSPKEDLSIVALDICRGKLAWTHTPSTLSWVHFEAFEAGIVAYPNIAGDDKSNSIFLHPDTGRRIPNFRQADHDLIAASYTPWPPPQRVLENGWSLVEFAPGYTKIMRFAAPGQVFLKESLVALQEITNYPVPVARQNLYAWEVEAQDYPHQLAVWKDYLIYAYSYLSDEGVIYAFEAGNNVPAWTADLNTIVSGHDVLLTRMAIQVINDTLYVSANEHAFAFSPETGVLIWHRNLVDDLGLSFRPDFFGGGITTATFAQAQDILIISYERRVIALHLSRDSYLWHIQPDTFPQMPYPVIHDSKVYLPMGAKHEWTELEQNSPSTCWSTETASSQRQPSNDMWGRIVFYGLLVMTSGLGILFMQKKFSSVAMPD